MSINVDVALNIWILILKNLALDVVHVLLRHLHVDHPAYLSGHGVHNLHVGGQLHAELPLVQVHLLLYFLISHFDLIIKQVLNNTRLSIMFKFI